MAKVTGKAYISLDGTKLHSKADAELSVGGDIKKAQTRQLGPHHQRGFGARLGGAFGGRNPTR